MSEYPDRTQLQEIIAGMKEGVILIEPDQAITYANHSALEMHGVHHLDELGRTVDAYLANYVVLSRTKQQLDHGRTPIERATAGEWFDILVEVCRRDRPDEQWTHRVRSLVVKTPAGLPDCHVLVSADLTKHVEAEERFDLMFSANPAPAVICRLSDLRIIKVNEGFLHLSGYAHEDVIGHSVYEIDVLERAENRDLAIKRLRAGETIPQMEACLRFPNDPEHFVIVAGQPLEIGSEPCMLFTFADLEDRRKAEVALGRSEERFAKAFRLSPIPTMVCTVDRHRYVDVNDAFGKVLGYGIEEVVGRTADDLELWADSDVRRQFESAFAETGSVRGFEAKFHAKSGAEIDCIVSAEMVTINDQDCVLCVFQDITERKRSEAELVAAIESAMSDTSWFSRGVIEKLAALRQLTDPGSSSARLQDLTPREREILGLICRGTRDPEIGSELSLSPHTVRNHIAAIYRKLGINRRSEVVIWARERGLDGAAAKQPRSGRKK
ncbi:helix-turn-helix transcriptional regulator [uncultured Enterovirga sp.]|uniref:helix-turn-helix transcriptional regulator n=1 Tax=uncultured Enterovirga sp. TaxID=2026352 RepID=UPI0035CAA18D